jgi:hypothetical protein
MVQTNKKGDRSIEIADPDFCGASVEIERASYIDLRAGIRWRKNFDADFRGPLKKRNLIDLLGPARCEPGDVDSFDASGSGNGTLGERVPVRQEFLQEASDTSLAISVEGSWRRTHENISVLIGFNAIRELGKFGIHQDLGPAPEIKPILRCQVR